ncbi:transketolase family protein [Candidatus Micrarchaeota archaeon]|nr:transketolase family protein [Candidatus Micrarchaeota archaeon]
MNLAEPLFGDLEKAPSRDGFGNALAELGEKDPDLWVVTADVSESTRTHLFQKKFPERFVQVGVAEQNMAGVAAGIASCGKTVFCSAYCVFSPGRNWDQIRVSVCYNDVPVKFHGSHSGLTVGPDGASHQALEDISLLRSLPNMIILSPADSEEARKVTNAVAGIPTPAYIRTSREKMPIFTTEKTPFEIGKANVLADGDDVAIFATGTQVYQSLLAAEELKKERISAAVVNVHTIKPIDEEVIVKYAKKTGLLVSVEEHQISGGLGSAVSEVLTSKHPARLIRHGMHDQFGESGSALGLLKKYNLDKDGIKSVIKDALGKR